MEITGEALGMARIGRGMERDELAKLLGVSLRTVANWEKNGVPPHRIALVMTKMGPSIRASLEALEYNAWQKTPAGMQQLEKDHENLVARGEIDPTASNLGFRRPISELLSPYPTAVLLREVSRRVRNLEAEVESLGVDDTADELTGDADPDYSDMSEQDAKDYGLAAKEADPNIGHDELPHEP